MREFGFKVVAEKWEGDVQGAHEKASSHFLRVNWGVAKYLVLV